MGSKSILRDRLVELKNSIAHQRQILEEFLDQEKTIQLQLDLIIYPARCLPSASEEPDNQDPARATLLFLRICSAWRMITFSTPALWATLYMMPTRFWKTGSFGRRVEQFIENWFKYAGELHLSLTLHEGKRAIRPCPFPGTIRHYAIQLRHLDVEMRLDNFEYIRDVTEFPLLRRLLVKHHYADSTDALDLAPIQMFSTAPKRQRGWLLRRIGMFAMDSAHLVWHLHLLPFARAVLGHYMSCSAPRPIRSLHKTGEINYDQSIASQSLSHSHIESLALVGYSNTQLLRFTTFPALRRIEFPREQSIDEKSGSGTRLSSLSTPVGTKT
ncbi:hypothetical protein DFH07DRAFT_777470 [Mycena maculata]|uniref:F-box domain-containing protein n=1 Tax=Mycena maculata TaxID=230809 RepID=A0AAD7IHL9_9AGAR|nr:hypothetical protein DFH07DRAFT_777470 [Mycena maculata]